MLPLPPANPSDNSSQLPPQHPAATHSNVPQQGPIYSPPQTPPPSSNRNLWIILGSILGGGCLLTICGIIAMIGVLSLLGRRVETTFDQINSGLEQQESSLSAPGQQVAKYEQAAASYSFSEGVDMGMLRSFVEPGTASVQPKAGFEFMVVRYKMINHQFADTILASEILEARSHLEDGNGQQYKCCATNFMKAKNYHHITHYDTGTEFNIVYEVPKSAKALFLIYRDQHGKDAAKVQIR